MQIKKDMLLIIINPIAYSPTQRVAQSSAKLVIIMRVNRVLPVFPKATVDHMLMWLALNLRLIRQLHYHNLNGVISSQARSYYFLL